MIESGLSGPIHYLSFGVWWHHWSAPFSESYSFPWSIQSRLCCGVQVLPPACLQGNDVSLSWFFLGCLSGSVGLGVMPPALALASVPLVHEVLDGRRPSSAALTPAAVAPLVAPQVSEVESSTLPSVMLSHPGLGLSLSPATSPFPQKLVDRVRSGQFVDMRDLLTDNVSLIQQLNTFGGNHAFPSLPGMLRPRLREVTSLPSWIYCFLTYIAIRANDQGVRDMLAYAHLMVREAQRHGGSGWLDYDRVFRQQAALDPSLRWNTLHPGIQAATLVGRTAAYTGNQTTLQDSVPSPTSSLPQGPPMLLVHQFGHLALGLLWWLQWRTYACPGTKGIARSRARVGSGMPALHASSPIWQETVQQPLLTRSTNVGVVAGTQPLVPARDPSFDVAG